MSSKFLLLFLFLIQTISSDESANENFVVVSTTNRPTEDHTEHLDKRIRSLESEMALIQKKLDTCTSNLLHLKENLLTQMATIEKKLKESESSKHDSNPSTRLPRNCKEVQDRGHSVSDVYFIQPEMAPEPFLVLCDMEKKGGGWTYILNRFNGSQNFGLDWEDYVRGFGIPDGEFWLGLKNIHFLTGFEINQLLIELVDWETKEVYALYSAFGIGNEEEGYSLKLLRGYSGDAGDSFTYHLGMKFSTKDKDQDLWEKSCAAFSPSGWWYNKCDKGQLTGKYLEKNVTTGDRFKGIYWDTFHKGDYSLKEARMMVRPAV